MKALLVCEIRKLIFKKSVFGFIIVLSFLTGYFIWNDYHHAMTDMNYREQDAFLHQYSGEWSEEKYQQIKEDFIKEFQTEAQDDEMKILGWALGITHSLPEDLSIDNIDTSFQGSKIDDFHNKVIKHQIVYKHEKELQNNIQFQTYIHKIENDLQNVPDIFDSPIPNNLYFQIIGKKTFPILLLSLFVIVIILSNTFGIERQSHMEQILFSTQLSKSKIVFIKWLAGSLIAVLIMMIQLIISLVIAYFIFPIHTWNLLAQITDYIIEITSYTYFDLLCIVFLLSIVSALAISTLTLLFSYVCKNRFQTVLIMIFFLVICCADYILSISWPLSWPWNLFKPNVMLSSINYITTIISGGTILSMTHFIFGSFVVPYWLIVSAFWLMVLLIGIILTYLHAKRNAIYEF